LPPADVLDESVAERDLVGGEGGDAAQDGARRGGRRRAGARGGAAQRQRRGDEGGGTQGREGRDPGVLGVLHDGRRNLPLGEGRWKRRGTGASRHHPSTTCPLLGMPEGLRATFFESAAPTFLSRLWTTCALGEEPRRWQGIPRPFREERT